LTPAERTQHLDELNTQGRSAGQPDSNRWAASSPPPISTGRLWLAPANPPDRLVLPLPPALPGVHSAFAGANHNLPIARPHPSHPNPHPCPASPRLAEATVPHRDAHGALARRKDLFEVEVLSVEAARGRIGRGWVVGGRLRGRGPARRGGRTGRSQRQATSRTASGKNSPSDRSGVGLDVNGLWSLRHRRASTGVGFVGDSTPELVGRPA